MRRLAVAAALVVAAVSAACAPKTPPKETGPANGADATAATPAADGAPTPAPTGTIGVPVVIWRADKPFDLTTPGLETRDGILARTKVPDEDDTGRVWPFELDYYGIARTDLDPLLGPYVGRHVRVKGVYRKVYVESTWRHEVDPESIAVLP